MKEFVSIFAIFYLASCSTIKQNNNNLGIVFGKVVFESGNQMPGMQLKSSIGVKREVCVFNLLQIESKGGSLIAFEEIHDTPIKTVMTDDEGNFEMQLEEGVYSLLIKEEKGYFVPSFDVNNNLNPISVEKGTNMLGTFTINYSAYY